MVTTLSQNPSQAQFAITRADSSTTLAKAVVLQVDWAFVNKNKSQVCAILDQLRGYIATTKDLPL